MSGSAGSSDRGVIWYGVCYLLIKRREESIGRSSSVESCEGVNSLLCPQA